MAKKKILAIAIASLGVALVVGVGSAMAREARGTSLAEKLATQFGLDKGEVQKVIDSDHAERHVERRKHAEERLQEAVDAGKLTVEQKNKIVAKMKELASNREQKRHEMKNMTKEERRMAMVAEREDLKKWMEENNIPAEYMMFGGHGHGHGAGKMQGDAGYRAGR